VQAVASDDNDFAIVKAMCSMVVSLGMEVVVENVEDATQVVTLRALGGDMLQGYLFGKPQTAGEFSEWKSARISIPVGVS
jgi:EAL domain-containing protein (putative c-di-GMP-specific phosphodiesterase class I)